MPLSKGLTVLADQFVVLMRDQLTTMRQQVAESLLPWAERFGRIDGRLDALERREPVPGPAGKDADPETIRQLIESSAVEIAVTIESQTRERVDAALGALRQPVDGESAYQVALRQGFAGSEAEWLKSLEGKPGESIKGDAGRDADPEFVRSEVQRVVAEAVGALPQPRDGKDVDPEFVRAEVARAVGDAIAQIPAPKDGRDGEDVDMQEVGRLIDGAVLRAVDALPKPKDGKDADPEFVRGMVRDFVAEAVAAIPAPQNGKDADPEAVRLLVQQEVATAVSAIPKPKDGESVHPDTITRMVAEAIAALPKPKDGEPGRDATEIQYHDGLDETRSYPRGSHVIYRSGVIVAVRATDPVVGGDIAKAGWAVTSNSVHSISDETLDDGRTIRRTTEMTDGRKVISEYKTGMWNFRHVYDKSAVYDRGDIVSWGGESWLALQDGVTEEPRYNHGGTSPWQQIAKKGRDGKAGDRGVKGDKGEKGDAGWK